jgi:methylthioribose-1-phosphate isomerase
VANPAFDITPARLVTAIVTEQGVVRPPFQEHLARVVARAAQRAESSRAGT